MSMTFPPINEGCIHLTTLLYSQTGLDTVIKDLDAKGVKLLAYINPYLNKDGNLFKEAEEKGYFMKNKDGDTYMMVNGDNPCGTIDLTNPEAFEWYKGRSR